MSMASLSGLEKSLGFRRLVKPKCSSAMERASVVFSRGFLGESSEYWGLEGEVDVGNVSVDVGNVSVDVGNVSVDVGDVCGCGRCEWMWAM